MEELAGYSEKFIGEDKDFSLEVLYRDGGNMTDADEIAGEVTRAFGEDWFFQSEEERKKGVDMRRAMSGSSAAEFFKNVGGDQGSGGSSPHGSRGAIEQTCIGGMHG